MVPFAKNETRLLSYIMHTQKSNEWIFIKRFYRAKETNKQKRQSNELEEIFTSHISDKGPVSKICKEFIKLSIKKKYN